MNSQEKLFLEVPLGIEAHRFAGKFAAEQGNPEKSKQVYLNTLAVYATHRGLKWLGIKTDLSQSDSWHPVCRNRWNVADLVIPNIGQLECRPVLPGDSTVFIPQEATEERIGYLAVQLNERLDQVQLLGFTKTAVAGVFEINRLRPLDELIDELSNQPEPIVNVGQWFDGVFDELWQSVEALLTPRKLVYKDLRKSLKEQEEKLERAKKIELGRQQLILLVEICLEESQEIRVLIQVHPVELQEYLPARLKLKVALESDSAEVEAREADNWIQLALTEFSEKLITVQVSLDDESVTEQFMYSK